MAGKRARFEKERETLSEIYPVKEEALFLALAKWRRKGPTRTIIEKRIRIIEMGLEKKIRKLPSEYSKD